MRSSVAGDLHEARGDVEKASAARREAEALREGLVVAPPPITGSAASGTQA